MKILLISPAIEGKKKTNRGLAMPQLALYIIDGLTPKQHEVKIVEEEAEKVNLEEDCDLVGISCMTANAPRAYKLSEEFRNRGKTVVLGGVHPTILPDEALQYSDSVVIGEVEGVWKTLLDDFQNNNLKKKYQLPISDQCPYVRKDFSKMTRQGYFNLVPIMTTRGCPYNCDFCCVSNIYGKKIRHLPIQHVLQDIKDAKAKNFMFLDDNIIGHPKYAKELFRAIKPMKIKWVGQASISLVKDTEMMQLAAESGCRALFIGLESVSVDNLKNMRKSIKDLVNLETALKKIRNMKILVHASMIFGFDNDNPSVFKETVDFLTKNRISSVSFNVLTPYPGTKTFEDLKAEGRLLTTDWQYYDHNTVVYKPTNMSPYELQTGKTMARKSFYNWGSVLKRFSSNMFNPAIYLATNYGNMRQTAVEVKRLATLRRELF